MLVRPQLKVNASPPFLGALAPRSDQKILQSTSAGDINVTNNRATILKSIQLDTSPATKNLVNISEVRHDEVGACSRFVEGSGKAECDEGPPTDDRGRVSDWERSSIGKGGRPSRCVSPIQDLLEPWHCQRCFHKTRNYFTNLAVDVVLLLRAYRHVPFSCVF